MQLRNLPEEYASTRMETIPSASSVGGGSDMDQEVLPHTRAVAVALPRFDQDCVLRVSVAAGKWETLLEYTKNDVSGQWPSSSQNGDKGQFAFAPPLESEGETIFTLTHSLTQVDFRVVAFDKDGTYRHTIRSDSHKVGDLIQTTVTFDMRLAKIVRFEIQQRPYEEAHFPYIPLKVTLPSSLMETIPDRTKAKLNPKYFLSFPLMEKRVPTADEDGLLTRIFDRHRQIKDVRVVLTQNSFSLVTRPRNESDQKQGYLPINEPERLHLPERGQIMAMVAGDLGEKTAIYARIGDHWWADVSSMMGMRGTTHVGFNGKKVWFRFAAKVEILPATQVNVFNVCLASPMGLKIPEGDERQNTVYLGVEDYQGPCHVIAQRSEGCQGSDTHVVHHYYFDKDSLLLKKIETFYWITGGKESPIFIFEVNDYVIEESPSGLDAGLFEIPTSGVIETKGASLPGLVIENNKYEGWAEFNANDPGVPVNVTVGLSDASNGSIQASYQAKYNDGSLWGSGLN